jgi:hypothetical protein
MPSSEAIRETIGHRIEVGERVSLILPEQPRMVRDAFRFFRQDAADGAVAERVFLHCLPPR